MRAHPPWQRPRNDNEEQIISTTNRFYHSIFNLDNMLEAEAKSDVKASGVVNITALNAKRTARKKSSCPISCKSEARDTDL
ncbi:hypothetical protein KFK09_012092 [Dendrobium nobile]|uniref:Uncharacterized protein n=1 Tax=Dendrobium nobile TaxID=94219 RepID=A0A8T3BEF0_DENNO|nr:hypothetical protein KFK09_012092 [Dendrobium nobile]